MTNQKWLLPLLLATTIPVEAADTQSLEERHRKLMGTSQGQEYEMKAVQAFWGDACFMRTCVASTAPTQEQLTIYFVVKKNGTMGQLIITPDTPVAKCIARNVKTRIFPTPPGEYVGIISLTIGGETAQHITPGSCGRQG